MSVDFLKTLVYNFPRDYEQGKYLRKLVLREWLFGGKSQPHLEKITWELEAERYVN